MLYSTEKLAGATSRGLDTMMAVFNTAFDSSARLVDVGLGTSRSLFAEGAANACTALDTRSGLDLFRLEVERGQTIINKTSEYIRNAYAIVAHGQEEVFQLIEPRIADFSAELATALDNAAKSVPASSDLALSAVMSALQVARQTAGSEAGGTQEPPAVEDEAPQGRRKTA